MTRTLYSHRHIVWLLSLSLFLLLFALSACGSSSNAQGASSLSNSVNTTHISAPVTNNTSGSHGNSTANGVTTASPIQHISKKANAMLNALDGADNDAQNSSNSATQDNQPLP